MALTMTMIITVMLGLACLELYALWRLGEHAETADVRPGLRRCGRQRCLRFARMGIAQV
jgi:hypothetical protein